MGEITSKRYLSALFWLLPLLAGGLTTLYVMSAGIDSETMLLWVYPYSFGHRPLDVTAAINVTYEVNIFRPLHYLSFTLDFILFGNCALGYRIENLIWYMFAIMSVMLLMRRLNQPPGAVFAAGMFLALHPAHAYMLYHIHSRTDIIAALFFIWIAWCFIPKAGKVSFRKVDYWLSLVVMLAGIFWKENFFIVPLLLLFGDLCCGWTEGKWWKRVLYYIPYVFLGLLSLALRMIFISGFGYRGWDMWKLFAMADRIPTVIFNYLNTVWGLTFWNWSWLGLCLTIVFLILGDKKTRLALLLAFLLLFTYLPSKVNYMHVFVTSVGLAIWMGMVWQMPAVNPQRLWRRLVPWVASGLLLVAWAPLYIVDLPQTVWRDEMPNRIVKYLVKRYPAPQPNTAFALDGVEVRDVASDNYRLILLDEGLKLMLNREDVGILQTAQIEETEAAGIVPVVHVAVPPYLKQ
jgi:hypothetical protein